MNYIWLTPHDGCRFNVAIPVMTKKKTRTKLKIKIKDLVTRKISERVAMCVYEKPKPGCSGIGCSLPFYYLNYKGKKMEIEELMRIKK